MSLQAITFPQIETPQSSVKTEGKTEGKTESKTGKGDSTHRQRIRDICVPFTSRISTSLFFGSAIIALYAGWQLSSEAHLTAESGTGYALGIIGGSLMLLLLLYPLRKRARFMRGAGPVKWWFRSHMVFGVVGPIAVLYHSNFELGSINSNVALFCMLLVAGSGLIGRYIYTKIHYGLYGRKATLHELKRDSTLIKNILEADTEADETIKATLKRLERRALAQPDHIIQSMIRLILIGLQVRWYSVRLRFPLRHSVTQLATRHGWSSKQKRTVYRKAKEDLQTYLTLMGRIGHISFYERLFALWHVLHFPLFLMMVISGIVHVVAVHVY